MTGIDISDLTASDAVTAAVAGFFMWLVARVKTKNGDDGGTSAAANPSQQMVDQMQSWTDRRLAESEKWTQQRLSERDERIGRLEKRVSTLETKYRAALDFIRRLIRRHPENVDEIPTQIKGDL